MIHRTYLVSFPRSGHHWLVRMLQHYFGEELHYCEHYTQPECRMENCPETNLEKSHDFDFELKPAGRHVIVLYRKDAAASMLSWIKAENPGEDFQAFTRTRQEYWIKFLAKWTRPVRPGESRMILTYCDLLGNPVIALGRVVAFLSEEKADLNLLLDAIQKETDWDLMLQNGRQTP